MGVGAGVRKEKAVQFWSSLPVLRTRKPYHWMKRSQQSRGAEVADRPTPVLIATPGGGEAACTCQVDE